MRAPKSCLFIVFGLLSGAACADSGSLAEPQAEQTPSPGCGFNKPCSDNQTCSDGATNFVCYCGYFVPEGLIDGACMLATGGSAGAAGSSTGGSTTGGAAGSGGSLACMPDTCLSGYECSVHDGNYYCTQVGQGGSAGSSMGGSSGSSAGGSAGSSAGGASGSTTGGSAGTAGSSAGGSTAGSGGSAMCQPDSCLPGYTCSVEGGVITCTQTGQGGAAGSAMGGASGTSAGGSSTGGSGGTLTCQSDSCLPGFVCSVLDGKFYCTMGQGGAGGTSGAGGSSGSNVGGSATGGSSGGGMGGAAGASGNGGAGGMTCAIGVTCSVECSMCGDLVCENGVLTPFPSVCTPLGGSGGASGSSTGGSAGSSTGGSAGATGGASGTAGSSAGGSTAGGSGGLGGTGGSGGYGGALNYNPFSYGLYRFRYTAPTGNPVDFMSLYDEVRLVTSSNVSDTLWAPKKDALLENCLYASANSLNCYEWAQANAQCQITGAQVLECWVELPKGTTVDVNLNLSFTSGAADYACQKGDGTSQGVLEVFDANGASLGYTKIKYPANALDGGTCRYHVPLP
jgi:hypothetical protein